MEQWLFVITANFPKKRNEVIHQVQWVDGHQRDLVLLLVLKKCKKKYFNYLEKETFAKMYTMVFLCNSKIVKRNNFQIKNYQLAFFEFQQFRLRAQHLQDPDGGHELLRHRAEFVGILFDDVTQLRNALQSEAGFVGERSQPSG